MKIQPKALYKLFASAGLGVLLMLAFAPFEIFPLAVLAPAGLCALIYRASPRRAFWYGYSFGIGLFGSGVYWVFISISQYGDVPAGIAFLITAGMIAFLSLYPAATCYLTNKYFTASTRMIFAFPAIWVLSEWVRSWLFTGFPWLLLGYSQTNSPLKGYAPIFSVYGISLALVMTSGLLVNGIMALRKNDFFTAYKNLFAITAIWIAGALLALIPWTQSVGKPVTVSLIQGNIPQSLKWNLDSIALSLDTYRNLTASQWGKSDLIIWPEVAIPLPLTEAKDFVDYLSERANASGSQLIFGIPVQTPDASGYYNAILAVGKHENAYLKRQLVPFGEYVPMQPLLARALDFMHVPMSSMKAGKLHQGTMDLGNVKILPSICYEIAYPDLSRSSDKTAGLLLTVTNDAWFGRSTAQAQHLQMAAMRSIEMARPGLFVSNDGITAIINDKGIIESAAPTHTPYVLTGSIQQHNGLTPWMNNGLDPLLFIAIILLIAAYREKKKITASRRHDKINNSEIKHARAI